MVFRLLFFLMSCTVATAAVSAVVGPAKPAGIPVAGFSATIADSGAYAVPSERILTNWSNAGVAGRYGWSRPEWIYTNVTGLATDGSTNVSASLQSIINAVPINPASNAVVYLPPGIYCLSNAISMRQYVTIRGSITNASGAVTPYPTNSELRAQHSANAAIDYTGGLGFVSKVSLFSGATKGSTNIVLAGRPTNMEPNALVFITQTNALSSGVTSDGWESATVAPCNYCSIEGTDYIWSQAQALEILSVTDLTNLTFRPALYATMTNNASLYYSVAVGTVSGDNKLEYAGLEKIHLRIPSGYVPVHGIQMDKTADCWIRDVRLSGAADKALLKTIRTARLTFTNNVVVDNPGIGAASGGGVVLFPGSFDYLVSDNIFDACREPISINGPNSGVISYNYITNCPNVNTNFLVPGISFHGAFPAFVLVEGNVVPKIHADLIHGSSGWNVLHRNLVFGRQPTLGGITNDSGQGAIWIDCTNWFFTLSGNMLGYSGVSSDVSSYTNEIFSPTVESDGDAFNNVIVGAKGPAWPIRYGYSGFLTNRGADPVINSTLVHVDTYSYYTNATLYATNATVQSSLYLPGSPGWFGALAFPPFGRERASQNFTFASGALAIPAGYRWNNNGANP